MRRKLGFRLHHTPQNITSKPREHRAQIFKAALGGRYRAQGNESGPFCQEKHTQSVLWCTTVRTDGDSKRKAALFAGFRYGGRGERLVLCCRAAYRGQAQQPLSKLTGAYRESRSRLAVLGRAQDAESGSFEFWFQTTIQGIGAATTVNAGGFSSKCLPSVSTKRRQWLWCISARAAERYAGSGDSIYWRKSMAIGKKCPA